MNRLKLLVPGFLLSLLAACAPSNKESDGPIFCQIDQTETYALGTNPTVNFNATNIVKTTTFNGTDCPDVNTEPIAGFVSRVKRQGNLLTVIEAQFSGGQFTLELETSGTTVLEKVSAFNKNRCTIRRVWDGTINTPVNGITINELITYRGNCENVFLDPNR